ncbi:MAG: ureidoglycolate lyase [Gammaproteobacteria bacterium]|nr:ureidoglycolate lyase [Gammaproteobacteria bacterium]
MNKLTVNPLTRANFANFGDVVESEGRDSYFINNGMAERFHKLATVEAAGEEASVIISLVKSKKFDLPRKVDHVEYHPFGSQAFLPLDETPFVVVVAKAGEAPSAEDLHAFVTNGKQGINYHAGTWHHVLLTPYAAMDFICVDRAGKGNNCIDHFYEESQHRELLIPAG